MNFLINAKILSFSIIKTVYLAFWETKRYNDRRITCKSNCISLSLYLIIRSSCHLVDISISYHITSSYQHILSLQLFYSNLHNFESSIQYIFPEYFDVWLRSLTKNALRLWIIDSSSLYTVSYTHLTLPTNREV